MIVTQISAIVSTEVAVNPVEFTTGEDTPLLGGNLAANGTQVNFSSIPLPVDSNVTVTQLVNITNTDSSDHDVGFFVTENFGSELSSLSLYLVSPSGKETLFVYINDSGIVTTEEVSINIPPREEWAIKLVGRYDSGTSLTQSNTLSLSVKVLN